MYARVETLCALSVGSWILGVAAKAYLFGISWLAALVLTGVGFLAAPVLGVWLVTSLPELWEWESTNSRTYLTSVAIAAVASFASPVLICYILGI